MPTAISTAEPPRPPAYPPPEPPCSLAEVLDRILHRGVSLEGNLTIGVADVELLFLDLRLLLAAVDTVWADGLPYGPAAPVPDAPPSALRASAAASEAVSRGPAPPVLSPPAEPRASETVPRPDCLARSPSSPADGLFRLVLTLVKLLHDVLERMAVRRMNGGQLSMAQIDKLGSALQAQAVEIDRLRREFGFEDRDLSLNLGLSDHAM